MESITESQIEAMLDSSINTRIVLIEESIEARLRQQRDELETLLQKKIEAAGNTSMSKQEIEDFLDERLVKMSEMVSDQLINLKETLGTEIVNSTMLSRNIQEIARETALTVAEEKVSTVARNLAQSARSSSQAGNPTLDARISQQLSEVKKAARSQALIYSVLAAIVGAGTAVMLFFLTR